MESTSAIGPPCSSAKLSFLSVPGLYKVAKIEEKKKKIQFTKNKWLDILRQYMQTYDG